MYVNTISSNLLLFFVLHFPKLISTQENEETTEISKTKCREQNSLIGSNNSDFYDLTEVMLRSKITLECHYCNENEISEPKVWYKIDWYNNTPMELKIDMNKNESLNKISVSVDHTLTIHHANLQDAGIYYCQGLLGQESSSLYNFVVDLVFNNSKLPEKGNLSLWKQYHNDYIVPINKFLLTSNETEYILIRDTLKLKLELITDWEINWNPCEICGRPRGEGIQIKYGFCRIKIENFNQESVNLTSLKKPEFFKYFLNLTKVSCKSLLFEKLFPGISNLTKWLSDFTLVRKCDGVCNPDAAGVNMGWKFGKGKGFKYRRTIVLNEGEHLTLVCPESTLDNTIIWRRNGKVLNPGGGVSEEEEEPPHIVVDAFNSLYLIHVTEKEEGNYTCQVDDIRMQQIKIFIALKSRLLTQELVRHMAYLAFILTLSCSCYCAGLIAACKRRHKFKGYSEVNTFSA